MADFTKLNGYDVKDTTARNDISNININIGDLTDLTTTEKSSVVGAINEVDGNIDELESYFNINTFVVIGENDMELSNTGASIGTGSALTLATNSDSTLFKLYGKVDVALGTVTSGTLNLTFSTSLRPSTQININNAGLAVLYDTSHKLSTIQSNILTINTDGTCSINVNTGSFWLDSIIMLPCLYFLKDFGD